MHPKDFLDYAIAWIAVGEIVLICGACFSGLMHLFGNLMRSGIFKVLSKWSIKWAYQIAMVVMCAIVAMAGHSHYRYGQSDASMGLVTERGGGGGGDHRIVVVACHDIAYTPILAVLSDIREDLNEVGALSYPLGKSRDDFLFSAQGLTAAKQLTITIACQLKYQAAPSWINAANELKSKQDIEAAKEEMGDVLERLRESSVQCGNRHEEVWQSSQGTLSRLLEDIEAVRKQVRQYNGGDKFGVPLWMLEIAPGDISKLMDTLDLAYGRVELVGQAHESEAACMQAEVERLLLVSQCQARSRKQCAANLEAELTTWEIKLR